MTAAPTTGLHHVAFTVSDLDRSIEFYSGLGFGLTMRWTETPEVCADGLGVPGASIELAQLSGNGMVLELIRFFSPTVADQRSRGPEQVGSAHVALLVDDIDDAHQRLIDQGIEVISDPVRDPSADSFQIVDPDGIRVELLMRGKAGAAPATASVFVDDTSETPPAADAQLDVFSAHRAASKNVSLAAGRTALLVVDMLNDFCVEGGAMVLPGSDVIFGRVNELTAATRQAGGQVVWVCDRHESTDDAEFRKRDPHCLAGTWGAEVVDALERQAHDWEIPKSRFSAFYRTDLDERLKTAGVDQLVVCGVVTNICVRSTCHDAFFIGYDVYVPEDACYATGPREQASSLYDIETHFGTVTSTTDVVAALTAGR